MFINGENISELVFIVDLIATRVFDQNEAVFAQGRTGCRGMIDLVVVLFLVLKKCASFALFLSINKTN